MESFHALVKGTGWQWHSRDATAGFYSATCPVEPQPSPPAGLLDSTVTGPQQTPVEKSEQTKHRVYQGLPALELLISTREFSKCKHQGNNTVHWSN